MNRVMSSLPGTLLLTAFAVFCAAFAQGQAASGSSPITLSEGALSFQVPGDWESAPPRNNLIEREFRISAPPDKELDPGRLTVMAAGGSIDANIARWIGQFQNTEGGANRDSANIEKETADGMPVTFVDIEGTYLEGRPFGPKTPRPGYRMLAAIVQTDGFGNYFFKLVGPSEALAPESERFRDSVLSLRKSR